MHHYFRRPGYKRGRLPGLLGSAEFMQAYQQAFELAPQPVGAKRNRPGSVGAVVAAYLDSTLQRFVRGRPLAFFRCPVRRLPLISP